MKCKCGCGETVAKGRRYKRYHHWRKKVIAEPVVLETPVVIAEPQTATEVAEPYDGPPAYPATIDRRRWRLAEERPGISPRAPWISTRCTNCREPMWTRDPLSTWEQGGICEECLYITVTEMTDARVKQQNRTVSVARSIDPFGMNR